MVGSLLAGLSQEMWQLVAARGVQGLGAGALFPIALAVIADLFAPSERGRYQGLFGAVFGLSVPHRPGHRRPHHRHHRLAVRVLLQPARSARVVFVHGLALPAARTTSAASEPKIDYLGAALFTGALVPILVGLTNKQTADWTDPVGRRADRARAR